MKKWITRFMITILFIASTTIMSSCRINDFHTSRRAFPCGIIVRRIAELIVQCADTTKAILNDGFDGFFDDYPGLQLYNEEDDLDG